MYVKPIAPNNEGHGQFLDVYLVNSQVSLETIAYFEVYCDFVIGDMLLLLVFLFPMEKVCRCRKLREKVRLIHKIISRI